MRVGQSTWKTTLDLFGEAAADYFIQVLTHMNQSMDHPDQSVNHPDQSMDHLDGGALRRALTVSGQRLELVYIQPHLPPEEEKEACRKLLDGAEGGEGAFHP